MLNNVSLWNVCLFLFTHSCQYIGSWCDCRSSESFSAIKPDSIHYFLHKNMSVPNQKYDSCYTFVWCLSYWFCQLLRNFPFWIFSPVFFCIFNFFCIVVSLYVFFLFFSHGVMSLMSSNVPWSSIAFIFITITTWKY